MAEAIARSALDCDRFGVEVYRARVDDAATCDRAIALDREVRVDLTIARTATHRLELAQRLEAGGFFLCDTLVYFEGSTERFESAPDRPDLEIGPARADERAALEGVARAAFASFFGHYHADPRLDGAAATEGYVEWCLSSLDRPDDLVLVARVEGRVAGFLTAAQRGEDAMEIVLNGVHPDFQRRGIYDALVKAVGHRAHRAGLRRLFVSTQVSNLGPQKVWARNGLAPSESHYTFHKWYAGS